MNEDELKAKILELQMINEQLNVEAQKYYDRYQALIEENLLLMAELYDARSRPEKR